MNTLPFTAIMVPLDTTQQVHGTVEGPMDVNPIACPQTPRGYLVRWVHPDLGTHHASVWSARSALGAITQALGVFGDTLRSVRVPPWDAP